MFYFGSAVPAYVRDVATRLRMLPLERQLFCRSRACVRARAYACARVCASARARVYAREHTQIGAGDLF